MAEYTIPKPYRDFYVTNPYIELKESNERLQRIVKSGYVAKDSFEGAANQVITFDSPKHGFSLTNDSSEASSWNLNLYNKSLWEQGTITNTGDFSLVSSRIRTKEYTPTIQGATYTIEDNNSLLYYSFSTFDENKNYINAIGWIQAPYTVTFDNDVKYIRIVLASSNSAAKDITVDEAFSMISSLNLSVTSYTAPSDVTVKVAENVAGIPTTADGWEQGVYSIATGLPSSTEYFVRTSNFIPVKSNVEYTLNASFSTNTYYVIVSHYDENKQHIETTALTSFPVKFKTSNETKYIHISLHINSSTQITPTSVISELTYMRITSEPMIVNENDTRIVTMPPFTSLYIESNVPYHGHALDLAE